MKIFTDKSRAMYQITVCCSAFLLFGLLTTLTAQDPASNIRVQAKSNIFIVFYDLSETSDVDAFVSFNGGASWQGPLREVSGSVGKGIAEGRDKIILWNAPQEIGYVEQDATIRVIATRVAAPVKAPEVVEFLETVDPVVTAPAVVAVEEPQPIEEVQPAQPVATAPSSAPPAAMPSSVPVHTPAPQPAVAQTPPPPPVQAAQPAQTSPPPQRSSGQGSWTVIIGSFVIQQNAEAFARTVLAEDGITCEIIFAANQHFRVSAGRFETLAEANSLANQIRAKREVWVIRQ